MGSILPETEFKVLGQGSQHHSHESPSNGVNSNGDTHFTKQDILEPIAVVGVSFKFPEDAISEDSYWQMMLEKRCVSKVFPKERTNIDGFHNSDPNKSNTVNNHFSIFEKELAHISNSFRCDVLISLRRTRGDLMLPFSR